MSTRSMSNILQKTMGDKPTQPTDLPLTQDLTVAYALSLAIALLLAVAAAAGLFFRTAIYPGEEVFLAFAPVDLFHLLVGLPVLLASMGLARQGKLAGLLCWPGPLLYVMYTYTTNLVGMPFGPLFLPYLLLLTLSAYATIVLVTSIDHSAVHQQLAGKVPATATGIFLVVITGLFSLMAVGGILGAVASQDPVGPLQKMLWIADLATLSPPCLAGGILLLRRRPLGYTGGTGLLLAYSMLFFGLVPAMVFPAIYGGSPVDLAGLGMMVGLGLLSLVLLALFLRGAAAGGDGRS